MFTLIVLLIAFNQCIFHIHCDEVFPEFQGQYQPANETKQLELLKEVHREYEQFNSTTTRSVGFLYKFLTASLTRVFSILDHVKVMRNNVKSAAYCAGCNLLAAILTNSIFSRDTVAYAVKSVCKTMRIQKAEICESMIDNTKDELDFIRLNSKLTNAEICGVLLGAHCYVAHSDKLFWEIPLPGRVHWPPRRRAPAANWTQAKFVQITDIHLDKLYTPGSNAECDEPLCCRAMADEGSAPSSRAGSWADYRQCDVSVTVLEDALRDIHTRHEDAWFWLWTGDIAPHNVWSITRAEVREVIHIATDQFEMYRKKGVRVFPLLGNHEGVAINSFPPPDLEGDFNPRWLFNYAAEKWAEFLPSQAVDTFTKSGNYRVRLAENIVLLVVNSNYCSRLNFWTYYDPVDPGGQLTWLNSQLLSAEWHRDAVHIAMHVPPDNRECTQAWLYNYLRIMERYQDIIAGQYYGHTHRDEFRVMYSLERKNQRPIGVQFIAPSLTSYSHTNPSYRVYLIDNRGHLLNHETYSANLTTANERGAHESWSKSYDAKSFHGIDKLSGHEFDAYIRRIESSHLDFQDYFKIYMARSDSNKAVYDEHHMRAIIDDLRVDHPYHSPAKEIEMP
ncbi:Sphingomyelin phosphodiesterase [Halotydeus destructor]|nr:Sphingomyelin phosphodiesterase [Halotydeus destructor]